MSAEPAISEAHSGAAAPARARAAEVPRLAPQVRRAELLPFSTAAVGDEELSEVTDTLRSGWISTGPKTARLEAALRSRVGAADAVGLNSCTAGLHVGLRALGVRTGDEVITTPMTFCACANVIEHLGARPVLADVEPDTLNLDPEAVEAAITSRTRAILAVHYAGHPVDLDAIQDLASRYELGLIEDAAHALPASYKGGMIGSGNNPVSFSFHAGDGGMLTGPPELITTARMLSLHGMRRDTWKRYGQGRSWFYEVTEPGFRYNMTDVQAAMGLAQLKKLERFQQRRREIVARYNAAFGDQDALEIPVERPEVEHAWHLYVLRLRLGRLRIGRGQFIEELAARNIGTSVHFIPLHIHPFYRRKYDYLPDQFPVAHSAYRRMLSLPLYPTLTDGDVNDVITAVLDVTSRFAR